MLPEKPKNLAKKLFILYNLTWVLLHFLFKLWSMGKIKTKNYDGTFSGIMTYNGLENCILNGHSYENESHTSRGDGCATDSLDEDDSSCSSSKDAFGSFSSKWLTMNMKKDEHGLDEWEVPESPQHFYVKEKPGYSFRFSDVEVMKERFSKLLLGEDVTGGKKGLTSALALSNAITNLAGVACIRVFSPFFWLLSSSTMSWLLPEMLKWICSVGFWGAVEIGAAIWRKKGQMATRNGLVALPHQLHGWVGTCKAKRRQWPNLGGDFSFTQISKFLFKMWFHHIVGFSFESLMEQIMTPKARADIHMNLPALQKLDSMLIVGDLLFIHTKIVKILH